MHPSCNWVMISLSSKSHDPQSYPTGQAWPLKTALKESREARTTYHFNKKLPTWQVKHDVIKIKILRLRNDCIRHYEARASARERAQRALGVWDALFMHYCDFT